MSFLFCKIGFASVSSMFICKKKNIIYQWLNNHGSFFSYRKSGDTKIQALVLQPNDARMRVVILLSLPFRLQISSCCPTFKAGRRGKLGFSYQTLQQESSYFLGIPGRLQVTGHWPQHCHMAFFAAEETEKVSLYIFHSVLWKMAREKGCGNGCQVSRSGSVSPGIFNEQNPTWSSRM